MQKLKSPWPSGNMIDYKSTCLDFNSHTGVVRKYLFWLQFPYSAHSNRAINQIFVQFGDFATKPMNGAVICLFSRDFFPMLSWLKLFSGYFLAIISQFKLSTCTDGCVLLLSLSCPTHFPGSCYKSKSDHFMSLITTTPYK